MIDSYVFIHDDYKKVFEYYYLIDNTKQAVYEENKIIYDDMIFENRGEWCLITVIPGDSYAEDILLDLSHGKTLIYLYTDDVQLDFEFVVIQNNSIIRKKYLYTYCSELDEDEGQLLCERSIPLHGWNDLDKLISIAMKNPEMLFRLV